MFNESSRQEIYSYRGLELPINADEKYRCIPMLIERMSDEFTAAMELHSKVLAVRIDLQAFEQSETNTPIEELIRWFKQDLKRRYYMKNIGHFWVRENSRKKGIHWHIVLLLDGNIMQSSWAVTDKIKNYWEETKRAGRVFIPKNCFTQIKRGDKEAFNKAFYRASYLAKERSKGASNKVRCFGASKLAKLIRGRNETRTTNKEA